MTLPHEPCASFGWGFEVGNDYCDFCSRILDCSEQTTRAKVAVQIGHTPNIPIAKDSQVPKVYVEKPREMDGKILFAFRIDSEWLKKQLGWNKR